ncbi:MAG: thiamine phosphate synthase [Myxococcota bacterium]
MKNPIDHVYAIIDDEATDDPMALCTRAIDRGCVAIQLRAKTRDDHAMIALAQPMAIACRNASIRFFVNDRTDIAVLVGATGVHLGQDDMPPNEARAFAADLEIGVSTHNLGQAMEADDAGVDWIAVGPIFRTQSKRNPDPVVGLDGLRRICRQVRRPVIAIGGITPKNWEKVIDAGARQIAVISALPKFLGP